ncbi:SAM-dependent methyltransferase [Streptomyces katrae]|uniref:SAM-dependent methyltransferase n=1 Tax=Streptomyces katrae TaxID=68223 RepID=UPI00131CC663|nr:SAM-dependent methyltransferase [Streptomyces katrae]
MTGTAAARAGAMIKEGEYMGAKYKTFTPGHIDASQPHPGRVYNALLGGKDHYEVDAAVAAAIGKVHPNSRATAWAARHCMERMATFMAREGITQFLDLGCGSSIEPDLDQIVRSIAPDARVVSVDSDPIVARRSEAFMSAPQSAEGRSVFLQADLCDPSSVLDSPEVRNTLDLTQPVGLCFNNVLCFIDDARRPHDAVAAYVEAVAPGSLMSVIHPTADFKDLSELVVAYNSEDGSGPLRLRGRAEILRFFTGLELIEPGLDTSRGWRSDIAVPQVGVSNIAVVDTSTLTDEEDSKYAAVARKSR